MTNSKIGRIKRLLITSIALGGVLGAGLLMFGSEGTSLSLTTDAVAASDKGQGQGTGGKYAGGSKKGRMGAQGSGLGKGKSLESSIFQSGGRRGSKISEADEDSDRPEWAQGNRELNPHAQGGGQPEGAGDKKGDLYGDLYIILRDENGVPVLDQYSNVQPVDVDGNLIPINEEGEPVDEAAAALLQEVEFSRLSIARAPSKVIDHALEEALDALTSADSITVDEAGRLVVTTDGETKTIDSPLENLALYEALMVDGSLPVTLPVSALDLAASLYGAASDKTTEITIDQIVYMNSILGINVTKDGETIYYNYLPYTYDRTMTFDDMITYLKDDGTGTGTYITVTESIMTAVFADEPYSSDGGIDGFTQATDDSRTVIEFIHDVPVPTTALVQ